MGRFRPNWKLKGLFPVFVLPLAFRLHSLPTTIAGEGTPCLKRRRFFRRGLQASAGRRVLGLESVGGQGMFYPVFAPEVAGQHPYLSFLMYISLRGENASPSRSLFHGARLFAGSLGMRLRLGAGWASLVLAPAPEGFAVAQLLGGPVNVNHERGWQGPS